MDLSIAGVARSLDVSESTVRSYIASGRLQAEQKGQYLFVSEAALRAFLEEEEREVSKALEAASTDAEVLAYRQMLRPVLYRLSTLQKELEDKWNLSSENQRLLEALRQKEREIAEKSLEAERMRRDLIHQKRLHSKELEEQQKTLEEKWAVLQKETVEQIARERSHFEEKLALVEKHWAERIAEREQEYARRIKEAGRREGLWSRLVKMMTWS